MIFKKRESVLLLTILLIITVLSINHKSDFFSSVNILGIFNGFAINLIMAVALTVLFISGGFDISIGATFGLSGILVAIFLKSGQPILIAILLTMLIALSIGCIMGFFISYVGLNPFITSLAFWFILLSLKLILAKGTSISGLPKNFKIIANFRIYNVTTIIIIGIALLVIFDILLRKNLFFRQSYFLGGNEEAALLAGIKVKRTKMIYYGLVSLMAAVAGILFTARVGSAVVSAGETTAFVIITGVIIGGASLGGGGGSAIGTFFGLVIMSLINNALVLYGVPIDLNKVVIGLFLLLTVSIDAYSKRKTLFY